MRFTEARKTVEFASPQRAVTDGGGGVRQRDVRWGRSLSDGNAELVSLIALSDC